MSPTYEPSHPRGKWASRGQLAKSIREHLAKPENEGLEPEGLMAEAIEGFGLSYEFKILRLTEQLKVAIKDGLFGPLHVPNTVDVEGKRILTPVGEVYEMFRDIYTPEFLDLFDEEGQPLSSSNGGD